MHAPSVRQCYVATAALAGAALVLTACGGSGSDEAGSGSGQSDGQFNSLINAETDAIPNVLDYMKDNTCSAQQSDYPLEVETVPQTNLDQQLQLRAGQEALPDQFAAGNAPALAQELAGNGQLVDLDEALTELDARDNITDAAASTIESLYGGLRALPYEFNVEGLWYNKQIFEEHDLEEPQTWTELVAAADTLNAAGVQPFSASGEQGWPLTRFISGYLYRDLGPEAMQRVADGEARLTDPEYVEAATAVAELGEAGYFGQGVSSLDMDTSESQYLNGDAAMIYNGSWFLSAVNDEERNQIGIENVGFMPFPEVEGGQGDLAQYPSNVGIPMAFGENAYNEGTAGWLECISSNYGADALREEGQISGFTVNDEVADIPEPTQDVQQKIDQAGESVLWFEALFNTKATNTSQSNAGLLVSGSTSPEDFMAMVQNDLDVDE